MFVSLPFVPPRIRDIATPAPAPWQPGARVRRGRDGATTEDPAELLLKLLYGLVRLFILVCCSGSTPVARTVRRGCLTEVLYGITSTDSLPGHG